MSELRGRLARLVGGYSPIRRAYRRLRPRWMAGLSPAGREILRFVPRHGLAVTGGPFRGMRYPKRAVGHVSILAAKLLGAYERELEASVESLVALSPNTVVNVGAADGYYAVGLAMRLSHATVHAFDLDAGERHMCARLARENGVADRVRVRGFCGPTDLAGLVEPGTVLVVDCEGYEDTLLDPRMVPGLRRATMLVELHPTMRPGVIEQVEARFAQTHTFDLILGESRSQAEYPALTGLGSDASRLLLSEGWTSDDATAAASRRWVMLSPRIGADPERDGAGGRDV